MEMMQQREDSFHHTTIYCPHNPLLSMSQVLTVKNDSRKRRLIVQSHGAQKARKLLAVLRQRGEGEGKISSYQGDKAINIDNDSYFFIVLTHSSYV